MALNNKTLDVKGGCLCGQVRYSISAVLIDAGFCHCRICQRSSGAPTLMWLTIPRSGFQYTHGHAAAFSSSKQAQREFCAHCGTQIAFRVNQQSQTIDVTVCSLDNSAAVEPEYHIWMQSKAKWLHVNDELPRYRDAGPDAG